jgi:hypothetical protein
VPDLLVAAAIDFALNRFTPTQTKSLEARSNVVKRIIFHYL